MNRKSELIIFFLALFISGCDRLYYMPNAHNVPLFKEKNEFRASGAFSAGSDDPDLFYELQTAYSFKKNWACMANFLSTDNKANTGDVSKNVRYIDGALGYFKPINRFGVFEIYGGLGACNQHHQYSNNYNIDGTANLNYIKLFIQPSFGLTTRYADLAISWRLSDLYFSKVDYQLASNDPEIYYLDTIAKNRNSYLFEPALTMRVGWKYVKLQLQLLRSFNLNHPNLRFEKSSVSLGLYITIAKRYFPYTNMD